MGQKSDIHKQFLQAQNEISTYYASALFDLDKEEEVIKFHKYRDSFKKAIDKLKPLPFDPRFNTVYWAFDLINLSHDLVISYSWMMAYAKYYKKINNPGNRPSDSSVYISYFANNCVARLWSFRDKVALMVWAFYDPFNPEKKEKLLAYDDVVKRLKFPAKFGFKFNNHQPFLDQLIKLKGPRYNFIKKLRDLIVHRREPIIELFKLGDHQAAFYMLPLTDSKDVNEFKKQLRLKYSDVEMVRRIENGCYVNGILFDRRPLMDNVFIYQKVEKEIKRCLLESVSVLGECLKILNRRDPIKKK